MYLEEKAGIEVINVALVGERNTRKWKAVFRTLVGFVVITDVEDVYGYAAFPFPVSSCRCSLSKKPKQNQTKTPQTHTLKRLKPRPKFFQTVRKNVRHYCTDDSSWGVLWFWQ